LKIINLEHKQHDDNTSSSFFKNKNRIYIDTPLLIIFPSTPPVRKLFFRLLLQQHKYVKHIKLSKNDRFFVKKTKHSDHRSPLTKSMNRICSYNFTTNAEYFERPRTPLKQQGQPCQRFFLTHCTN
jgi:hypothetical protein